MILHALNQAYDRFVSDPAYGIAPEGWSSQKISFQILLKPDGRLEDIQSAEVNIDGKLRPQPMIVPGYGKPSGSGINPCFLWDNAAYLLGHKPDDKKPERTRKCFEHSRDKHIALATEIDCPAYQAVAVFFTEWQPERISEVLGERQLATGFGVFKIIGQTSYIHQAHVIQTWWNLHNQNEGGEAVRGQCLVSGATDSPIARLQPKIKGVMGAQSAGASIVSFNDSAYTSYGLEQAYNAPVAEETARRYGGALNAMLNGPKSDRHRMTLGDATVVFWTDSPSKLESFALFFAKEGSALDAGKGEVDEEDLFAFLKAVQQGTEHIDDLIDPANRFHILGLSPNAARLSVRFYHQSCTRELLETLRRHVEDIRVIRQFGEGAKKPDLETPPLWLLLAQTARVSKEIPPLLGGGLLRAVLTGTPYPISILQAVVRRIRADRLINHPRACLLKGVLTRNLNLPLTMALDPNNTNPAYLCGRLFAALEKTQSDALGKVNSSIRDRFYGAASATPRAVFPRLLRTYSHHLGKLHPGMRVNRERLVQDILDPINAIEGFPAQLTLEGQSLFALGFYHQTKDLFTSKKDKPEPEGDSA